MASTTRRELLGAAAGGAALSLLPRSLHEAMAMPMRRGGLRAIEHVVVLMQENRSFDHYFGTMRGVRGYGDRAPLMLRNGRPIYEQPNPAGGSVLPFSLRVAAERAGRPDSDIQYLGDLDHSWVGSTTAWAQGWNDAWIGVKTPATMTYYERRDIPLQYELAETFTFCDAYHCSVFGSTNPNRNYLVSGTTGFEPGSNARAVTNAAYSYDHAGYSWTTYAERLEAAGISWQVYQEWDNFTDNAIEYFVPFKRVGTKMLQAVEVPYRTTEEFYDRLFGRTPAEQQRLLAQLQQGRERLTPAERRLFDRGMFRSEPESLVPRLRADIAAGRLPAVSWLVPSAVDSEHPGASTPVGSANLVHDVLDALASDRETWSKTVLFVNFDENDGYFDHVPPPVPPRPPSGEGDDWFEGKPIGLSVRVPMTVVSPWTIGGHVCSEVFDHTSVIRFLERWTGVEEPNISDWRRTVCGDLTSALDFDRQGRPPRLEEPGPVPAPIARWHPGAPADAVLPGQERGRRPLRALPYGPSVSALVDRQGRVELTLANRGKAAAHFAVYPYAGELEFPLHVDVERAHRERLVPAGDAYKLAVQGPNRFWYELAGTRSGQASSVDVRSRTLPLRSKLLLELENDGDDPVTLRLRALGYGRQSDTVRLRPGHSRTVGWDTDDGWYDLEVTAAEDPAFRRRLTGRVENGRAGVTA
jgi:phospholipase C